MKKRSLLFSIIATIFVLAFVTGAQQFDKQPGAEITQINPAPLIRVHAVRDASNVQSRIRARP